MMLICRLLPLLLMATWLPGQDDRLSEREAEMERRIKARAERDGGEMDEKAMKEAEEHEVDALKRLTPEERLARNVRSNASQFCRFVAAIKPQKLMPGQSGTMVVSALLNGQAVLPSPAPMEMIGALRQGVVTLGGIRFQPAEMGRHATGYLGRPVYDNFAVFEIPVSVAADATIGTKQAVSLDLRFDIYDGVSAQPIGRFVDRVATEVEIGQALDPVVLGGRKRPVDPAEAGGTAGVTPSGLAPTTPEAGQPTQERVIGGQDPLVTAMDTAGSDAAGTGGSASTPAAGDLGTPLPEESGMLPLPVWLGGGALLLVLVVMLARKK